MKIHIWDGGLQEQEIKAIEKIKAAFSKFKITEQPKQNSGSMKEQLRSLGFNNSTPWRGYAGFRFVDSKGYEGEFDLVIVTHCNIIIVELKDWNHRPITARNDTWYLGDKDMGRSPVTVTRNKKYRLKRELDKIKFPNLKQTPWIDFLVVMTGNADFSQLPTVERQCTISLDEFLKFADEKKFDEKFNNKSSKRLSEEDFSKFDEFFTESRKVAPKTIRVSGYFADAEEVIFEHPKSVYKEYLASSEISVDNKALLRVWDFNKLTGTKAMTPAGRVEIVSREQQVLLSIKHNNQELYNNCLRPLTSFEKDNVTSKYNELYELYPGYERFNQFIPKYSESFEEEDLLNLTKILIAKFADLHLLKIAHRDVASHSLWFSPSKAVAISNFISAYHQPTGTIGDYRSSLSVSPIEFKGMLEVSSPTPFQEDVHSLGLIAWHILTAKRISQDSLSNIEMEILSSDAPWYAEIIHNAIKGSYKDASEFFDALKDKAPQSKPIPTFDDSILDIYRRPINHVREYPNDGELLVENSDKEVYLSNGLLVKAWLQVGGFNDSIDSNFRVFQFLKKLEKLEALSFIPKIHAYGLASNSTSMYLVTDFIEGITWSDVALEKLEDPDKLVIIHQLIDAVEYLHELKLSHGDLHPANVILNKEDWKLFLIDIPDFSHNTEDIKNHLYSPENIDNCLPEQRDNYAVIKMVSELLELDWGKDSEKYPQVSKAIKEELQDFEFGFRDLSRFKRSLIKQEKEESKVIEVAFNYKGSEVKLLPDNEKVYVKVNNTDDNNLLKIIFTGIGGQLSTFYNIKNQQFKGVSAPTKYQNVRNQDIENSRFEVNAIIHIKPEFTDNFSALSEYILCNESFKHLLEWQHKKTATIKDTIISKKKVSPARDSVSLGEQKQLEETFEIPTKRLWESILATELESLPSIELNGKPISLPDNRGEFILPYDTDDTDPLGSFSISDEIEALFKEEDGAEIFIGRVSLINSSSNEVRLTNSNYRATSSLKAGDPVFFSTRQNKASFRRRKVALKKLIDKEGVLPDIVELFEPSCIRKATAYDIDITDEDFSRYDREDDHGNIIKLNEQQREAFRKLINYGPLSLLQGPPGTGKTEFIAAFVHYLIEKLKLRRILLVSQSHEAVNTAAERIRKHCKRLKTPLDIVRFSNRESAVSYGLKDVYSQALTTEKRELFNAEYRHRAAALSRALGIGEDFIVKYVETELKLFKQIDRLESLVKSLSEQKDKDDIAALKSITERMDSELRVVLNNEYNIYLSDEERISNAKSMIRSKLFKEYAISPDEEKKILALANIISEMQDALAAERVNYDEFYARSRQLVVGTCVGIGQGHIGIHENVYDYVIIDEAARSTSSELAIAMQSAKRILLVGDHEQLPPLYSLTHKKALVNKLGLDDLRSNENNSSELEDSFDELLKSDFARVFNSQYGKQVGATLVTQYRMAAPIGNLVSEVFYDGKLKNGERNEPEIYQNAPDVLRSHVTWLDTSSYGDKSYHESEKGTTSISNRCEAEQIIKLLKEISLNNRFFAELSKLKEKNDEVIGVICMYAEQKRLIRKLFEQEVWEDGFKELVKIDTVDSYQGKENRIIILSLTRSDKQKSAGFLRTSNRINVAISRAMDRLLIVGNAVIWESRRNKNLPLGKVISYMSQMGEEHGYKRTIAK